MNSDRILVGNELNQLILLCSQASFASTEEEVLEVPAMVFRCLRSTDILPSLVSHRGKAFAARALVSLSFFRGAMEARYHRRAAPKPEYYQQVAISYLHNADLDDVAFHFDNWVCFLGEHLA